MIFQHHQSFSWDLLVLRLHYSRFIQLIKHILIHLLEDKQMTPEAEKFNGWMAMIGFVAGFGAYATTGQIIPGIF